MQDSLRAQHNVKVLAQQSEIWQRKSIRVGTESFFTGSLYRFCMVSHGINVYIYTYTKDYIYIHKKYTNIKDIGFCMVCITYNI